MDFELTLAERAFRDEVRDWLRANAPKDGGTDGGGELDTDGRRAWQRKLYEAGYVGLNWPKEYGGRGATLIEQALFNEEMVRAKTPMTANVLGLVMGGPVVIAHGTEEARMADPRIPRCLP